jgi:D-arginine utilization repressor
MYQDKTLPGSLQRYRPICDAIAALFQPYVEVVLHELATDKAVYIAGNFSRRTPGEPSLLRDIDFTGSEAVIGPYQKINWDGRALKSITIVLRDDAGAPQGLMCVNADVSELQAVMQTLSALVRIPDPQGRPEALFKEDWHERINQFIQQWTQARGLTIASMTPVHRKALVAALSQNGAFSGKNAASYISRVLGMGRATVYKYLSNDK